MREEIKHLIDITQRGILEWRGMRQQNGEGIYRGYVAFLDKDTRLMFLWNPFVPEFHINQVRLDGEDNDGLEELLCAVEAQARDDVWAIVRKEAGRLASMSVEEVEKERRMQHDADMATIRRGGIPTSLL